MDIIGNATIIILICAILGEVTVKKIKGFTAISYIIVLCILHLILLR